MNSKPSCGYWKRDPLIFPASDPIQTSLYDTSKCFYLKKAVSPWENQITTDFQSTHGICALFLPLNPGGFVHIPPIFLADIPSLFFGFPACRCPGKHETRHSLIFHQNSHWKTNGKEQFSQLYKAPNGVTLTGYIGVDQEGTWHGWYWRFPKSKPNSW